jgi:hypothetical protein
MERVLAKAGGVTSYKFDSGPSTDEPWIRFNVNDMAYFFAVYLDEPERIYLERYHHGVDPRSFDGSFGSLDPSTPNGLARWYASSISWNLGSPSLMQTRSSRRERSPDSSSEHSRSASDCQPYRRRRPDAATPGEHMTQPRVTDAVEKFIAEVK